MRNQLLVLTSVLSIVLGCSQQKNLKTPTTSAQRSDIFKNEFVFSGDQTVVKNYLNSMGIDAVISPVAPGARAFQVKYKGATSVDTIISGLEGQVDYVEPNYKVSINANFDRYSWPNDRLFFKQWAFNNIGQSPPFGLPGTESADIDLLKAWATTKGSRDIVVAVIDTGVDYTHPDLKANIWVNEKESPQNGGVPGRDDDGNGYIDDVYGFDFFSGDRTEVKYGFPGDNDPMDEDGHGTHCAGAIGGIAGNAQGVVGVNQQVRIMPLRFIGSAGGSTVDAVRAIYYGIQQKVDIMSNSWGGGGDSRLLRDAIADAQKANILFIVAAGNEGSNIDVKEVYPASVKKDTTGNPITNTLVVGASDNQDNPADFSNYGYKNVDIFAPGVNIISTYPVALAQGRPYAVMSGTSMATPIVAGVAALLMSHNSSARKNPTAAKQILMQSADMKDSFLGKAVVPGRINAAKALAQKVEVLGSQKWTTMGKSIQERGFQKEAVDIRHEIKVPNAKAIRVHFDFVQIQEPYDSIYLYDKNLRLITHLEETETRDHWSALIPGDTVTVRFTNSIVQQMQIGVIEPQSSEAACASRGATDIVKVGDQYQCMADNEDSSDNKQYSTFNSEGFSIDRIEYIAGEGSK